MKPRPTGQGGKRVVLDTAARRPRHRTTVAIPDKRAPAPAMDVVYLDHQDHLVHQANQASLANPAHPAFQDRLAHRLKLLAKLSLQRHANHVRLVLQVHPAHQVHLEIPVIREPPAAQALMLHPDHPDHPAHLDHLVQPVPMDHPEMPAHQPRANLFNLASPETPAMLVPQAHLAHPAMRAKTAKLVNLVQKAPKVHPAQMVKTVNQVHQAHLVHRVLQAKRVSVRNIAPWTAVCSSKMERGDKRASHPNPLHSSFGAISRRIIEMAHHGVYLLFYNISKLRRALKYALPPLRASSFHQNAQNVVKDNFFFFTRLNLLCVCQCCSLSYAALMVLLRRIGSNLTLFFV